MPANGKTNGRFELPQYTPLNFSLTDGTDIPPPPDSPVEETAPVAPKQESIATANGQAGTPTNANGVHEERGRATHVDQEPTSPSSTTRPSSIRRFLSRKSLNSSYKNGTNDNASQEDVTRLERPGSALSGPTLKKSRSWFKRLGSTGGGNRTSVVYENPPVVEKPAPKGPPPPMLPELNQLKAKVSDNDEGSLGAEDMFKNIK